MRKVWFAAALFLLASAARADTVWNVSGTITSNGNNNASVTVDYSYVLDVGTIGNQYTFETSDQSVSGTGSLGTDYSIAGFVSTEGPQGYVPIFDSLGDEIDLFSETVPVFAGWYKCFNLCFSDFMPPSSTSSGWNAWFNGAALFTMTQTATDPPSDTPEASTGLLSLLGIAGLIGFAWDPKRKSHQGLLDAEYRGPWVNDTEHPMECKFCHRAIIWYMTPNSKLQPFTAATYEPHHGDCPEYTAARKQQKTQRPSPPAEKREPGEETSISA